MIVLVFLFVLSLMLAHMMDYLLRRKASLLHFLLHLFTFGSRDRQHIQHILYLGQLFYIGDFMCCLMLVKGCNDIDLHAHIYAC